MYFTAIILLTSCGLSLGVNVTYSLTTPEGVSTNFTNDNYTNVNFDPTRQYKIILYGWKAISSWYVNITNEYMKKGNINVIAAYYPEAVSDPLYVNAARNVRALGEIIGNLLISLNRTKNIPFDSCHLIGQSLGAHIGGIAGQQVSSTTGLLVGRATGLDPAWPGFYLPGIYPTNNRLNKGKAKFVDIIHTSAYGVPVAIGDVDWFPNGGLIQAGCNSTKNQMACHHQISAVYYILSILRYTFYATECANYVRYNSGRCADGYTPLMGDPLLVDITGEYYSNTNASLVNDYLSIFGDRNLIFPTSGIGIL